VEYTARERFWLWTLAGVGLVALNGAFIYAIVFEPGTLVAALTNPVAVTFIVEALVLVGVFAYLLQKSSVSSLHWGWFVFLSLLGSLAFALPVALLWPPRERESVAKP
jgi:hypothetical protein